MITFFTDPRPDELLYSACARYADSSKYPNEMTTAERLFGSKNVASVVDLPSRLDHLISELPPFHKHTSDAFIDLNTLWPYYAPFLPVERSELARNAMKGSSENRIRERMGSATGQVNVPSHLRFCQDCVEEDRKKIGYTYWHRIHQVTGVEVCPKHLAFLNASSVLWQERYRDGEFVSAEKAISTAELPEQTIRINLSDIKHNLLLKIANNSLWLLNWRGHLPGAQVLRDRYYHLLLKNGYAYFNGRIKTTKLLKNFSEFYTPALLKHLQCEIGEERECWLLRIVRSHKSGIMQHPLRHLLLMIFLDSTPEDLFINFAPYKPFGDGPWPCLNIAAPHYQQPVITECRVSDSIAKHKTGVPMGTFNCSCGFIYTRRGPDASEEDSLRFDNVAAYGSVWEDSLRKQWDDPTLALYQIARNLGVIPHTVTRHAIRLKLNSLRKSRNSVPISNATLEQYSKTRDTLEKALPIRRSEWLSVIDVNPGAGRQQLLRLMPYTYWWLRRNDPEWLEAHMPPSRTPSPPPVHVDWEAEDSRLTLEVEKAGKDIQRIKGRPVRVSLAEIVRKVGHKFWLERCLDNLPLTSVMLDKYLESREDYYIRRVQWAAECFREEGIQPKPSELKRRSCRNYEKVKTPKIEKALEAALESLSAFMLAEA